MGYCRENLPERMVKLIFKREALLYDIENCSFIEGDIMMADEHTRHQVYDIGQEGNIDRVSRILDLAYSECVEMLYPYTKERIADGQEAMNNVLNPPEEYTIELTLPDGFSVTTLNLLKKLIHEYLVCRVLADWMSITNRDSQANWENKMQDLKFHIKTSLVSRKGKICRKLKPF